MPDRLLDELRATPAALARLLEALPREAAPGDSAEWTPRQVLAHLADHELIAATRVRLVLSLDRPRLPQYGQVEFTRRFAHLTDPGQALTLFRTTREATLRVLEAIGPLDWERRGIHPVRGEETLRRTAEYLLRHDRGHLAQASEISSARLGSQ